MPSEQEWKKLEDKVFAVAKGARGHKMQNQFNIDSDVTMPSKKPWSNTKQAAIAEAIPVSNQKPWPKPQTVTKAVEPAGNCGQSSPQWPSAKVASKEIAVTSEPVQMQFAIDSDVVPLKRADVGREQTGKWVKGQSGNPSGKKTGTKNKITTAMRDIVIKAVNDHAATALERIIEKDPVAFIMIVLKFIPAELVLKLESGKLLDYSDMTYDQVTEHVTKWKHGKQIEKIVDDIEKNPFAA